MLTGLPERALDLLRSSMFTQFATVSSAGVPIDTPTLCFYPDNLSSIDIATGVAYPAKAERARKNPKVGLLIEGRPDEPVISISGIAAVRDANLQANAERYIKEVGWTIPQHVPWAEARKAIFYWMRIFVSVTPKRILWWDNPAAMDTAPHRLEAPAETAFPQSDPAPVGKVSAASKWPQRPWPELARDALAKNLPAHLTLCDEEGFPLPIHAREVELLADEFRVTLPRWTPWRRSGVATLTFEGEGTFVGTVAEEGQVVRLSVERALPVLPIFIDQDQLWNPSPFVHDSLMERLRHEAERRGQRLAVPPQSLPEPTAAAKRRMARMMGQN